MLWFIAIFKTVFIDITLPNNKLPEQIFQDYPSTEPYARLMYTTVKFIKVKKIRTSPKALVHEIFKKYERNSFLSFKLLFWYNAVTFSTDRWKNDFLKTIIFCILYLEPFNWFLYRGELVKLLQTVISYEILKFNPCSINVPLLCPLEKIRKTVCLMPYTAMLFTAKNW